MLVKKDDEMQRNDAFQVQVSDIIPTAMKLGIYCVLHVTCFLICFICQTSKIILTYLK
jgi:hypothetical protein